MCSNNWVDVRDIAAAHVRALTEEEAGGHRFITAHEPYTFQDWGKRYVFQLSCGTSFNDNSLTVNASRKASPGLPKGDESYDPAKVVHLNRARSDKFERVLGLKYHTMEETARAILENLKERGFWNGDL